MVRYYQNYNSNFQDENMKMFSSPLIPHESIYLLEFSNFTIHPSIFKFLHQEYTVHPKNVIFNFLQTFCLDVSNGT